MKDGELLATIFGSETHSLRDACAEWLSTSTLFRTFLEANAGKIRKKARQASDAESLLDLQLEMDAAYHLLADRRVNLTYEQYLAGKTRGPDFTAKFKGHLVFNVEVRRLRAPFSAGKLSEVMCEKLRQMPPGAVNVLLVGADTGASVELDVEATRKALIQRADAKEDTYFSQRGYHDSRDFLHALQRLSGVLVRAQWNDPASDSATLWLNPQAKHPIPVEVQKLLRG